MNNKGAVTGTAEGTASEVKAILVTISTNATPAGGNKNDVLYVDDLELIYNPKTESAGVSDPKIVIAGKTIEIAPNTYEYEIAFDALSGAAQRVIRKAEGKTVVTPDVIEVLDGEGNELLATSSVADTENGAVASVIVYSDDLKNKATYTVNMTGNVTGINDVVTEAEAVSTTYYNLLGEEFIEIAFRTAHEADPDAELYYNDYSMSKPGKREAVCRLASQSPAARLRLADLTAN